MTGRVGRRGLPDGDDDLPVAPTSPARRGSPDEQEASPFPQESRRGARRGTPEETRQAEPPGPRSPRRVWVAGADEAAEVEAPLSPRRGSADSPVPGPESAATPVRVPADASTAPSPNPWTPPQAAPPVEATLTAPAPALATPIPPPVDPEPAAAPAAPEEPWVEDEVADEPVAEVHTASPARGGARRGVVDDSGPSDPAGRRAWLAIGAVGLVAALGVGALYLAFGPTASITTPSPTPPSATETTPATGPGTSAPPIAQDPSPSASVSPTEPLASASPAETASASPTPGIVRIDLGDAIIGIPPGWQLYGDEVVQNNRRLVRIKEKTTDTRIQAVTLTTLQGPLTDACSDLMADHRQAYSSVAESLAITVPVSKGAEGIACSFTGTRVSDGTANKVDFTIVRRESDATSLVFRDTVPATVPADSPALAQLFAIECDAAESFGVTITQCAAATPAQGDG